MADKGYFPFLLSAPFALLSAHMSRREAMPWGYLASPSVIYIAMSSLFHVCSGWDLGKRQGYVMSMMAEVQSWLGSCSDLFSSVFLGLYSTAYQSQGCARRLYAIICTIYQRHYQRHLSAPLSAPSFAPSFSHVSGATSNLSSWSFWSYCVLDGVSGPIQTTTVIFYWSMINKI